jgi:N-acylneuraminate cytidylyltransferase|tara:strand:+ start:1000 stop:1650 length:651 start_codon:yes stop_codon:yes gene_type:complete
MKRVSIITARGGSKGVPQKNIIKISGAPLIAHTIQTSIASNVNETWVSTDDEEIADISRSYGANVMMRPRELSNDVIMPDAAVIYTAKNIKCDVVVFIQPTAPLLQYKYINEGLEMLQNYDSVFSAYKEHWYPRWRKPCNSQVYETINWNIKKRPRRQDVEEVYVENGAFYATTKKLLLETNLRYGNNIGIVEMPFYESFQIDTVEDIKLIEKILC